MLDAALLVKHVHGDGSAKNPFTLEGGDLRISVIYGLTNPYPIEPVCVGGGVVCGQRAMCDHKRADQVPTKRLVPIEDKVFLRDVRKLDLSHLCFSLNFYFLMLLRNFLLCFLY